MTFAHGDGLCLVTHHLEGKHGISCRVANREIAIQIGRRTYSRGRHSFTRG